MTGALAPGSSRLMGAPLVRGLDARRTTITIDGVPLGHSGLRDGSAAIPLGAIGSGTLAGFEVIRGPDVMDAGPSSPGGAIHMHSLTGPVAIDPARGNAPEVALTQRFSSADRGWSGGLSAAGEAGRLRYLTIQKPGLTIGQVGAVEGCQVEKAERRMRVLRGRIRQGFGAGGGVAEFLQGGEKLSARFVGRLNDQDVLGHDESFPRQRLGMRPVLMKWRHKARVCFDR